MGQVYVAPLLTEQIAAPPGVLCRSFRANVQAQRGLRTNTAAKNPQKDLGDHRMPTLRGSPRLAPPFQSAFFLEEMRRGKKGLCPILRVFSAIVNLEQLDSPWSCSQQYLGDGSRQLPSTRTHGRDQAVQAAGSSTLLWQRLL